jgi:hypothetical protein
MKAVREISMSEFLELEDQRLSRRDHNRGLSQQASAIANIKPYHYEDT